MSTGKSSTNPVTQNAIWGAVIGAVLAVVYGMFCAMLALFDSGISLAEMAPLAVGLSLTHSITAAPALCIVGGAIGAAIGANRRP